MKLNIPQDAGRRYDKAGSPQDGRPWPMRSTSVTPARGYPPRRPSRQVIEEEEEEAYPDELYDMYQGGGSYSRGSRGSRPSNRFRQPRYIDEDDEGSDYDDGSLDGAEFEMLSNNRRGPPSYRSCSRSGSRAPSRRPDIRKIRVKVHADDVRYIMVGAAIEFPDLADCIREKFGIRRRFKLKIRDEDAPDGDMITVGDQDDLDMALQSVLSMARRQRQDVAKMEVSFRLVSRESMPSYGS